MAPKLSGKESKMSMRLRIFSRRGSEDTYDENDNNTEEDNEQSGPSEHPERMSSLGAIARLGPPPPGLFGPVPYVNPRGHRLEARVEVSTLPRNNRAGDLNQLRGPRAVRPEPQEPEPQEPELQEYASQNSELQESEKTKSKSGATEPTPLPIPPMAPQLNKAQKRERRDRRRRKRKRRHRSRAKIIYRRWGPNLPFVFKNRGATAKNLPDTPPLSDGEQNNSSANKLSQLDDHLTELAELSDNFQMLQLQLDLAWKTTSNAKQAKQKLYRGYDLNNLNDIPNDEEDDSQSQGESEGDGKSESGESVDTVSPRTYDLAVEGNVAATPEPPEASEYQLVERPGDQSGDPSEDDRAQFIYIIATSAAQAECFIEPWVKYLESYSLGHFVITNPPKPPPMHSNFGYLPAIKPHDDHERQEANRMFKPLWDSWEAFKPKFTLLVLRVLEKFDVEGVAVSLFDEEDEIFAVERGLSIGSNLPREHSMAAHALAGADSLVVPDTLEDWRFAGNPLVTGPTNIRFFAAAPLLTHGSQAIAVLSIFDSEPRLIFTPRQRRELTDFADRLLTNLSNQVLFMTSTVVRNYPELLLDTWCLDELASRPCSPESEGSSHHVSSPIYPPLQLTRKTPTTSPTNSFGSFQFPPQYSLPLLPGSQLGSAASGSFSSRGAESSTS